MIDIVIAPFGLLLRNGIEVVARRPYPNKRYQVPGAVHAAATRKRSIAPTVIREDPGFLTNLGRLSHWFLRWPNMRRKPMARGGVAVWVSCALAAGSGRWMNTESP
nr:DUF6012 family protein [Xanthomonas hortorum]